MAAERRIVVVGASLAGVAAVEELRERGFDGEIVLVGAEPHLPYDRPPLSKAVLAGTRAPESTLLRPPEAYAELHVELELGRPAVGLELDTRRVLLEGGRAVRFDGLVVATGAAPILLPGAELDGVFALRTLDDCLAIRERLPHAERVLVVGGGFIGAEVAATAVAFGARVTILEALPQPMSRVLGSTIGGVCAALHAAHGVDVRCDTRVAELVASAGAVSAVRLADGALLDADLVIVGIGARPAVDWLRDSGLRLDDGVVCDARCGASAPAVVAAGDVARWRHPALGLIRIEHWENAIRQGQAAAWTLLSPETAEAYAPVPYVWSDQYDRKIQVVGRPADGDELVLVEGSLEERRFVALYGRDGRLTGGLAFNRSRPLRAVRELLSAGATLEDAVASFGVRAVSTSPTEEATR